MGHTLDAPDARVLRDAAAQLMKAAHTLRHLAWRLETGQREGKRALLLSVAWANIHAAAARIPVP